MILQVLLPVVIQLMDMLSLPVQPIYSSAARTGTWQQVQKLVASDRQPFDLFGSSVSISGNYALVGANSEDHDTSGTSSSTSGNGGATQAGSAYIFERNSGGGWQQVQKLVANDRQFNNEFGISVSLSGNYAIVGARYESHDTTGTFFQ